MKKSPPAIKTRLKEFSFILLPFLTLQLHGHLGEVLTEKDIAHFSVVAEHIAHTGTDACVQKVTDGTSTFIIKQIKNPSIDEQFLLINDVVASAMGNRLRIPINKVSFIPYDVAPHLKIYPDRAATLHSYVNGKDLESELPAMLSEDFKLQQRVIDLKSAWQKQWPLAPRKQGLTRNIIESMSVHACLPPLCALDTFVGNSDRSLPNIFYDQLRHSFCGIDQAASFSKQLASFACDRIKELIEEGYFDNCSLDILNSLCIYRIVLQKLYKNNEPETVIQSMKQLIPHLAPDASESTVIQNRLIFHGSVVAHNYASILQLIKLLGLIAKDL